MSEAMSDLVVGAAYPQVIGPVVVSLQLWLGGLFLGGRHKWFENLGQRQ